MLIAFTRVPTALRPVYCCGVGVLWNAFLSHTNHSGTLPEQATAQAAVMC